MTELRAQRLDDNFPMTKQRFHNNGNALFPDSYQQQLQIVLHEARQGGHQAPGADRQGDDVAAIADVGPAGDGYADGDVKQGESDAL